MERPEYVKCIRVDVGEAHTLYGLSWCGRRIDMEFHFQDIDHAAVNGYNKGRLVACPDCVRNVVTALEN